MLPRRLRQWRFAIPLLSLLFLTILWLHPLAPNTVSRRLHQFAYSHAPASGPLGPPAEYNVTIPPGRTCRDRFSVQYLENLRNQSSSYCSPASRSSLNCFHSFTRSESHVDSFCLVRNASLNGKTGRFNFECEPQEPTVSPDAKVPLAIPFKFLREYWYSTGPPAVFRLATDGLAIGPDGQHAQLLPPSATNVEVRHEDSSRLPPAKNYLLLKREGGRNTWHSLMEIMSAWMTMDVLRMARDNTTGEALFRAPEDIADTQVVVLDGDPDGTYFDLWGLFAERPPVRLADLAKDQETVESLQDATLIVPLAGASNPLWQQDWEVQECPLAPTVSVFVDRVLNFYGLGEPRARQSEKTLVVTFVDRTSNRRLLNQTALLLDLEARYPQISLRKVDFAMLSMSEQLSVVRETDILVGVHGAGLTHTMFMRENDGTIVELQPAGLNHFGFRNLATMRGLSYFRALSEAPQPDEGAAAADKKALHRALEPRRDWHVDDIRIEPDVFMTVMEAAIETRSKALWGHEE